MNAAVHAWTCIGSSSKLGRIKTEAGAFRSCKSCVHTSAYCTEMLALRVDRPSEYAAPLRIGCTSMLSSTGSLPKTFGVQSVKTIKRLIEADRVDLNGVVVGAV